MTLITWSWIFLVLYIGAMIGIGLFAQRKIQHADDFATARGGYGPFFLALAFAASTASGATFLGSPALSYEWGLAANWGNFLYPLGVYCGILISMRLIATAGNRFGNRSIPEYLVTDISLKPSASWCLFCRSSSSSTLLGSWSQAW